MGHTKEETFDELCVSAIKSSIVSALKEGDYKIQTAVNGPLANALTKKNAELTLQFDKALFEILSEGQFAETLKEQTRKALARAIVSGMQSTIDKSVQKLKADPVRHALILQAVNGCLENFTKEAIKATGETA